tara:strand:+ start:24 stop:353 length:330 start_codon:yes stop_codon:yes gene_type:complete
MERGGNMKTKNFLFFKKYKDEQDKSFKYLIRLKDKRFFKVVDRSNTINCSCGENHGNQIELYKPIKIAHPGTGYGTGQGFIYDKDFPTLDSALTYLEKGNFININEERI